MRSATRNADSNVATTGPLSKRLMSWGNGWPRAERCGLLLVGVAIILQWVGGWSFRLAAAPMNVGLVTLAMVHGAADAELLRRRWSRNNGVATITIYLVLLAAAAGFVWIAPAACLLLFVLVSAWHFGRDAVVTTTRVGIDLPPSAQNALTALRGFLVVGIPFLAHWEYAWPFFRRAIALVSTDSQPPVAVSGVGSVDPITLAVVTLAATGLIHYHAQRCGAGTACRLRWWNAKSFCEHGVLLLAGLTLHPLFFVGLYLGVWHAAAHLRELPSPNGVSGVVRAAVATGVFLVPVWMIVVGAWMATVPTPTPWDLADWLIGPAAMNLAAVVVLAYAVVTWPHVWLEWRSRREAT